MAKIGSFKKVSGELRGQIDEIVFCNGFGARVDC